MNRVLCKIKNIPVGYIDVSILSKQCGYIHLLEIYPEHRRQGHFPFVMDCVDNWAQDNFLKEIRAVTYTEPYLDDYINYLLDKNGFVQQTEVFKNNKNVCFFLKKYIY